MTITQKQMRKLMSEYQKTGKVSQAALQADMDRKTARKLLKKGKPWEDGQTPRSWRTRVNPFTANWAEVETHLKEAPELQAKSLFEWFQEQHSGVYSEGQLRSFQRCVRQWRALNGSDKEVYFPQVHHPGQRMQTDFTCLNEIGITICGQAFDHWACHAVLPYSNWEWAILCQSENYAALRQGVQTALWKLGHVPAEHWTDHTPVAAHWVGTPAPGRWEYNQDYRQLMEHFDLKPHMIQVASPNENGDVEAGNGAFKNRLRQHLLLRGSRDFADREQWRHFMETVLDKANRSRQDRLNEELRVMKMLAVNLLPEYVVEEVRVSAWSVIQVQRTPYSVPSRLIGEKVRVHRHEDRLEVYYAGEHQLTIPRSAGRGRPQIDYRHVIDGLVRKPGAFRDYRYQEAMFPTLVFRQVYDRLQEMCGERVAVREYLGILQAAARHGQKSIEDAFEVLRASGITPRLAAILEYIPGPEAMPPALNSLTVDLSAYDGLLEKREVCHE